MADNLTREQRSRTMAAVKGKDTSLEQRLDAAFSQRRWRYQRNVPTLPGKPDFVFERQRLIVFVDGDFWHGWRFPLWEAKLPDYWRQKIARNRRRDRRNFRRLRREGWRVLRLWEHQVNGDLEAAIERIAISLSSCQDRSSTPEETASPLIRPRRPATCSRHRQ